ncbi:hypothetical protein [Flexivirga caeni]|uniref:Uncharacterized protein n=1 Tax=Flexivirga caeni TaxID=2294115 RepID=A0A3M9M795_9MICO|nr:hypothetical protein [Flexivirga caeni]RNI21087.1 hypothetical protein EFY87_12475 [Flexivirga caeni]
MSSRYFSNSTSVLRIAADKDHFRLRFGSRMTGVWCLATPSGRSYLRMVLVSHAQVISRRMDDSYSTEYLASLRRWITVVGGLRELERSHDPTGSSGWGHGPA